MTVSRDWLLRAHLAHAAAAEACARALKGQAEASFAEHHSAETWRLPGGKVVVNLTNDSVAVVDVDAFMKWLEAKYPSEVVTETVVVQRVRNEAWRVQLLQGLLPTDPEELGPGGQTSLIDDEGTVVPGVVWTKGGAYKHAAITGDGTLKRQYAQAAAVYAAGGGDMPALLAPRPLEAP